MLQRVSEEQPAVCLLCIRCAACDRVCKHLVSERELATAAQVAICRGLQALSDPGELLGEAQDGSVGARFFKVAVVVGVGRVGKRDTCCV